MLNKFFIFILITVSTSLWAVEEFNFRSNSEYVPDFKNKFSGAINLNPSATKSQALKNINISYSKNLAENNWLDFVLNYASGDFKKFTTNNQSATNVTNAVANNYASTSTQMAFGAGYSILSTNSATFTGIKDLYEISSAAVTYNIFKESEISSSFSGPGLIAKFSLLKKLSDYVSVGGNLNYNLAVVKRSQNSGNETSSSRSLTISHLTLGFDLTLFL